MSNPTEADVHLNLTEFEASIVMGGLIMIAEADNENGYHADADTAVHIYKQLAEELPASWEHNYEFDWEPA